jgi:hypothetical protein
MLTPMNRAGGLPTSFELRMANKGRLVARHVPFPLSHGRGHCSSGRCLTVSGSRTSSPLQPGPVQYPRRPPERIRLHVGIGLRGKTHIRVPHQFLDRERIGTAGEQWRDRSVP